MTRILKIPESSEETDEQLLEAFKHFNSQDVLARLYLRYSDLVYGTCLKYLGEAEDAKDAVMNIYQELLKKAHQHEVTNFKGWLYVLAKNHCLMKLRLAKKSMTVNIESTVVQSGDFSHLDDIMEKEDEFRRLEDCLSSLTREQEQSIRLFYYESKCYNEIVEETGLDWNKVRSLIQNGRRNLKNCMENNGRA